MPSAFFFRLKFRTIYIRNAAIKTILMSVAYFFTVPCLMMYRSAIRAC